MQFLIPDHETILWIHDIVLANSSGRHGVLHPEAIDSAIMRPERYIHYDEACDIYLVCALILDSFARNHVFVDANKRTALMAMLLTHNLNCGTEKDTLKYGLAMNNDFEELVLDVAVNKPDIRITQDKVKRLFVKYRAT